MALIDTLIFVALLLALLFGVLLFFKLSPPAAQKPVVVRFPQPDTPPIERQPPRSSKIKARTEEDVSRLVETFTQAKVMKVCDGDTVIVAKGWSRVKIRLDSIDCPEDGQDWGDNAKYGLIKLIGGRTVHLEQYGVDAYGRTLATLYVRRPESGEWQNVNERMVMLGHAWVMRAYYDHLPPDRQQKLNKLEAWARSKKVGLWSAPNPKPPWQWRNEIRRPAAR
ncbi:MAG: thermonuclease family protein [Terricaulis sp.]